MVLSENILPTLIQIQSSILYKYGRQHKQILNVYAQL